MTQKLLVSTEGPARILTLNRPERLNALDAELRAAIARELRAAAGDPAVRAVILTGAGDRAFCSGQDLTEAVEIGNAEAAAWQEDWGDFYTSFLECSKPIIAAINGIAAGGGFVMCLLADIKLMVEGGRFRMAEVDVGLPSIFGAYLLQKQVYLSRTIDIVLTARDIPAEEAKKIGLVHMLVPPAKLMAEAKALAAELAEKAPTPLRLTIQRMRDLVRRDFQEVSKALVRYQLEAVASGQPQQAMQKFLVARAARKKAG